MDNAGTEQRATIEAYLYHVRSTREFYGAPEHALTCICCIMIRPRVCGGCMPSAPGRDKCILRYMTVTISSRRVYGCRDCEGHACIHSEDGGWR